jgi:hypothetical protein
MEDLSLFDSEDLIAWLLLNGDLPDESKGTDLKCEWDDEINSSGKPLTLFDNFGAERFQQDKIKLGS